MDRLIRKLFPYIALLLLGGALVWAVSFGTLPPADFTFANGTEIKSIDPAKVTGVPEHRIIDALFEGLYRMMPSEDPSRLEPAPGVATGHTLSEDGKTYRFPFRKDAVWTNYDGTVQRPVVPADFVWSWRRTLHPATASEYAVLMYYVKNAEKYNKSRVAIGDRVEVEVGDRPKQGQPFPQAEILSGVLVETRPPLPEFDEETTEEERSEKLSEWRQEAVYIVEVKPTRDGEIKWDSPGQRRSFTTAEDKAGNGVALCHHVLIHFSEVGVRDVGNNVLEVELENFTPYYLEVLCHYSHYPVHRETVEKYGFPEWTKQEHAVTNGPFRLQFRRLRDRIRLRKNPWYWNYEQTSGEATGIETVDAFAIQSQTTMLNMYMNGQLDWITDVPSAVIPELKKREDFLSDTTLITYFYRLNTGKKPLRNVRVRKALNMAVDKEEITRVLAAGQKPARSFVPQGLPGYKSPLTGKYDPARARRLLADAGYPNGDGFPKLEIVYNTSESHRMIAEIIGRQWEDVLGIQVTLRNLEWGVYLSTLDKKDYQVARAGWVGDYRDPNTFLDMFITNGPNNETNWSNEQYDRLLRKAAAERDPQTRLRLLHRAEEILMDELPVIPIYHYVSINMVRPYVQNFHATFVDYHPLHVLEIDQTEKRKFLEKRGLR